MTVQEYIDNDLPFYHITPSRNKEGILRDGLKCGKRVKGICVVRTDNREVWNDIASNQLSGDGVLDFIVIKLQPSRHNIKWDDVGPDKSDENTNHLHNYIYLPKIMITGNDIVDEFITYQSGFDYKIPDDVIDGYLEKYLTDLEILNYEL